MASRFWVGGTGTWDGVDLTHISATSGGAGGASNPGSGDTMTFDGSSGGGTVTVAYDPNVTSITMGAFTGTLDFNTRNPTIQSFNNSGAGTRTLTMGSGIWTISGSNQTLMTMNTTTGLTLTATTVTINCTYSGSSGTRTFAMGAVDFSGTTVNVTAGSDSFSFQMITGGKYGSISFVGFTGSLAGGGGTGLEIAGDLTLGTGMTTAATDLTHPWVFKGTSLQTITSNGVVFNHAIQIVTTTASVILADALNQGTSTITFTAGTFNTNGQAVTAAGLISSSSSVRTLTLGASNLTFTAVAAGTVFVFTTSTNLTITANTATINITGDSADFDEGTLDWNGASMVITGTSGVAMRGTSTWLNLTRTVAAPGIDDALSIAGNKTITGTFTLKGSSTKFRMRLASNQSQSLASTRTITAAAIDFEYVNLTDIQGAGAANWNLSAITGLSGDGGGNVGITFTTPVTQYWFGTTGNWTNASKWFLATGGTGGAGRVPLIQDNAIFDANSFVAAGNTVTVDFANIGPTNWTGSLPGQTLTWSQNSRCYGSMVLVAGTSLSSTFGITFVGRASNVLDTKGNTFNGSVTLSSVGFGMTLMSNLTLSALRTFTHFVGTFDANGYDVRTGIFNSNGTGVRSLLMRSGKFYLSFSTGATVWDFGTTSNLTYDAGTSEVIVTDAGSSTKTLNFANATIAFYTLTIPASGAGVIAFTSTGGGTREIQNLRVYGTNTLRFTSANTYNIRNFDIPGTFGVVSFVSQTPTSQYTIRNTGGIVSVYNANITDSIATGGAYFEAVNSVDGGNNTGWNFTTASAGGGLRSGKKFAAFGGARPINKTLDSKLHGYRKLGG